MARKKKVIDEEVNEEVIDIAVGEVEEVVATEPEINEKIEEEEITTEPEVKEEKKIIAKKSQSKSKKSSTLANFLY